jgi:DNA-directed RNA polymerase III subunit RPC6
MVYALIDDAGTDGVWSKTIKMKSNLHDSLIRAAIKTLENRHFITDMKSVEHPTRKMYIKANLRPSERATGGPWYTDGELDEEFIETISQVLYGYIKSKSFYTSKSYGRKPAAVKNGRVKNEDMEESRRHSNGDNLLPLPPGYQGYPTLKELTLFVENSSITSSTLTAEDIQVLLNVLVFDNKVEQVIAGPEGVAYKAVRKTPLEMEEGPRNGLTEAPCGRCPVFDLCEEGGPVGPSNCEYFKQWLDI